MKIQKFMKNDEVLLCICFLVAENDVSRRSRADEFN